MTTVPTPAPTHTGTGLPILRHVCCCIDQDRAVCGLTLDGGVELTSNIKPRDICVVCNELREQPRRCLAHRDVECPYRKAAT